MLASDAPICYSGQLGLLLRGCGGESGNNPDSDSPLLPNKPRPSLGAPSACTSGRHRRWVLGDDGLQRSTKPTGWGVAPGSLEWQVGKPGVTRGQHRALGRACSHQQLTLVEHKRDAWPWGHSCDTDRQCPPCSIPSTSVSPSQEGRASTLAPRRTEKTCTSYDSSGL